MCPEGALLSSYVDNELGPDSARRVERHVAECRSCREQLRAYQTVSHALLESHEPDVSAAGDRIWRRLDLMRSALRRKASFWTRQVRVPAPVAVAVMTGVALVITSVAMWAAVGTAAVGAVSGAVQPVSWLEQGAIVIQLPDEPQFIQRGKPAILRETEFTDASVPSAPLTGTQ